MAVAVIATLLVDRGIGNWGLIVLGVVIGTAVGVPAARQVSMTAMPQMVALFNGVGGGAVALIAWVEFRTTDGFADVPTYVAIFSLLRGDRRLGLLLGLEHRLRQAPGDPPRRARSRSAARRQPSTRCCSLVAIACGVAIVAGTRRTSSS